jgi:hypothetical protein
MTTRLPVVRDPGDPQGSANRLSPSGQRTEPKAARQPAYAPLRAGHRLFPLVLVLSAARCWSQTTAPAALPTAARYLTSAAMPITLRNPLIAIGDRLEKAGKERFTLAGSYMDSKGSQAIKITWELPGKARVDLTGASSHSILFDGATTATSAGSVVPSDDDLIESLGDDRAETLLYGATAPNFPWRFLGGWFRTDDGTTKNYTGPFYDIHQTASVAKVRSDQPRRNKFFCFDSHTSLLAQTRYEIERNGATVNVETVYTDWSSASSQAVPAQIVRRENGTEVFRVQISFGQVSPAANDGVFTRP